MPTSYDPHPYVQYFGRTMGNSMVGAEFDITELQDMLDFAKADLEESRRLANLAKDRGQIDVTDFPSPATTDTLNVDGDPGGSEPAPTTESAPVNY